MLTRYRMMRETIGLSQAEAADLVHGGVRLDTVKAWDSGKSNAPAGVIGELAALMQRLDQAAQDLARRAGAGPAPVPIGVPATPEDAYDHGFPSHQAMMRTIGLAIARLPAELPVEFVRIGDCGHVTATLPQPARPN